MPAVNMDLFEQDCSITVLKQQVGFQSKVSSTGLCNSSGLLQTFGHEGGLNCCGEEHLEDALRSHL